MEQNTISAPVICLNPCGSIHLLHYVQLHMDDSVTQQDDDVVDVPTPALVVRVVSACILIAFIIVVVPLLF